MEHVADLVDCQRIVQILQRTNAVAQKMLVGTALPAFQLGNADVPLANSGIEPLHHIRRELGAQVRVIEPVAQERCQLWPRFFKIADNARRPAHASLVLGCQLWLSGIAAHPVNSVFQALPFEIRQHLVHRGEQAFFLQRRQDLSGAGDEHTLILAAPSAPLSG